VTKNPVARVALLVLGTICVVLGAVALFIPVVPTTPFLLGAAACYARSSERFYQALLNHRLFGRFIRNYREKGGFTRGQKAAAIGTLWPAVLVSAFFAPTPMWMRITLVVAAGAATVYLLRLKTVRQEAESRDGTDDAPSPRD
jgi:uncharacterized membrane protein YbaN (DUF454 family)